MIETLYERIGGSATINAAVNTFYRKILADSRLRQFFDGVDLKHLQARQSMFLSMLTGGKVVYTRQQLRTAHAGARALGMDDSHFDILVSYFREALDEVGVPPKAATETAALLEATRNEVLGRP